MIIMTEFLSARRVIEGAVTARAFPTAVVEVGDATRPLGRAPSSRST